MTKQVVWTLIRFFPYSLIPSLLLNNKDYPRLAPFCDCCCRHRFRKVWHTTRRDENAECDMHGLKRPRWVSATQCLQCVWPYTAERAIWQLRVSKINDKFISFNSLWPKQLAPALLEMFFIHFLHQCMPVWIWMSLPFVAKRAVVDTGQLRGMCAW